MQNRTCSVEGCERSDHIRRGWCAKHYMRWRKHGEVGNDGLRPCLDCGVSISPTNANHRLCKDCKALRRNTKDRKRERGGHRVVAIAECDWCATAFKVWSDHPTQQTCSWQCAGAARRQGQSSHITWLKCEHCHEWRTHRTDHHCTYVAPVPIAYCNLCDKVIQEPRPNVRYCSPACKDIANNGSGRPIWINDCAWCEATYLSRTGRSVYCSGRCRKQREKSQRRFVVPKPVRYAIYERDGWRCQLCRKKVDPTLSHNAKWGPSLDHVVPRTQGGADTPDNLQLAHRHCNSVKCDGVWQNGEQLSLLARAAA